MRFSVVAALSLVSAAFAQSALTINTPTSLIECQPYAVTWSGGQSPYYVSVLPGGELSATALTTLGTQPSTATSYTWTVNIASGTSVTLKVLDSAGTPAYSAQVTIQAGTSTACLTSSGSSSAAASSGAASSAGASSAASSAAASSAAATSAAAAASTSAAAATTAAATSAAAATTASAAASATTSKAASGASIVGLSSTLLGVVGAAFLAIGA